MTQERTLYYVWYSLACDFSPGSKKRVMENDVESIYRAGREELLSMGFTEKRAERLSDKSLDRAEKILKWCNASGCLALSFEDPLYPKSLISDTSPTVLYVKGNVELLNGEFYVGIVGTRSSTPYGKDFAQFVTGKLADRGACIISGGADGIDLVALKSALYKNGKCIVVMGCDIDKCYPSHNYAFFQEVVFSGGAIVSEYPPKTGARWFAERNRIIAELSDRIFVAQASSRSGALITAEYASKFEVPIIAPDFGDEGFEGCRELILRGAIPYESPEKIMENQVFTPLKRAMRERGKSSEIPKLEKSLDTDKKPPAPKKKPPEKVVCEDKNEVREYERPILNHIAKCISEGRDIPDKMYTPEFPMNRILSALTELELRGEIENIAGNRFIFKR